MPDISMCSNETCPLRFECFRSPDSGTKPDEYRQAWMRFQPFKQACAAFMQKWHTLPASPPHTQVKNKP